MSVFKKDPELQLLAEQLKSSSAMISSIIYVPSLNPLKPPKVLFEFLDACIDGNKQIESRFRDFGIIMESYAAIGHSDKGDFACEFISDLHNNCDYSFIVGVDVSCNISQVNCDAKDEIVGFSCGAWNVYSSHWVLAKDLKEAFVLAATLGCENLKKIERDKC